MTVRFAASLSDSHHSLVISSVDNLIFRTKGIGSCCLMPFSPIFQLYHGCQFYWIIDGGPIFLLQKTYSVRINK